MGRTNFHRTAQGGVGMKKPASKKAPEITKPPYEPTPSELEAATAYMIAQEARGPRLKITTRGESWKLGLDHPNAIGSIALMKAIGTTDSAFFDCLMVQIVNASKDKAPSEMGANFMLSVVKGIQPKDQIEAMLAAQMAAVHMASMTFARRLAHTENIAQQDSAQNGFNKLTRTFAAQVSALKDYRSRGEQKMTVQHVHVAEGGQAIVGNVSASAEGVGAREKEKDQPHALGYAPGVEMPRQIEAERTTVPRAGGDREISLPDARGSRRRS
jgi:hypothetical protein